MDFRISENRMYLYGSIPSGDERPVKVLISTVFAGDLSLDGSKSRHSFYLASVMDPLRVVSFRQTHSKKVVMVADSACAVFFC